MAGITNTRRRTKSEEAPQTAETARERRSRRAERAQKSVQYATERPRQRSASTPMVTRRSTMYDMATPMALSNRVRRRIDIPIGATGGEFTLPSMPVVRIGWRAASALLLALMALCAGFLFYSPTFKVTTLEVKGLKRISQAEVSQVANVVGVAVIAVDPNQVADELKAAFPDLAEVKGAVGLPARVTIAAVERKPVPRWANDSGEHWVDQDGYIFPARGDGSAMRLVQADILPGVTEEMLAVIAGTKKQLPGENAAAPLQPRLDPALVKTLVKLVNSLPENAPLLYQTDHGYGWTDGHGWSVYFGKTLDNMDQKQIVYNAIANYLEKNEIKPVMVSVENPHAPYYRMEH